MTTPPAIFLSYNREDQARAKLFAEAFEGQGFKVWWDVGLRTGEAYDEVTETALRTAKAVVVLWSKKSVQSRWVRAEATLADRNKTLVPCMIEPCERPIMFELTQTAELGHWQGALDDRAWVAFLGDVRQFVAKEETPVVAAAPVLAAPNIQETLNPGQAGTAPSLAVLPFTNRSSLPEDEVFAEGMVEDVISALSQGANVRVLGSTATANLTRKAIADPAALGRQLGVRYLLEGNVRRAGANLRVATQLLEAETGEIIWTGRFDRPLAELSSLQEDLVVEIAAHLGSHLNRIEMQRALKKPGGASAWEAVMRAIGILRDPSSGNTTRMLEEARRAVAIAPDYGLAQSVMAFAEGVEYNLSHPIDPVTAQRIRGRAERAIVLDPGNAQVLGYASTALKLSNLPEEALVCAERALQLSPSNDMALQALAGAHSLLGHTEECVARAEALVRLAPGSHLTWMALSWVGAAYVRAGLWEQARVAQARTVAACPTGAHYFLQLSLTCSVLGREDEALVLILQARELEPGLRRDHMEWRLQRWFAGSPTLEMYLQHFQRLWDRSEPSA
jgi:TolB-like protein